MSKKQILGVIIVAMAVLAVAAAASHPLVDHWGQTASNSAGIFGSKWIHTGSNGAVTGLWGESASISGRGIWGHATSSSGVSIGVEGKSSSSSGRGVHGYTASSSGATSGVSGQSVSTASGSSGVFGYNNNTSGSANGVRGLAYSSNGVGVYGETYGTGSNSAVYGRNYSSSGVGSAYAGFNSALNGYGAQFHSSGHGVWISSAAGKNALLVQGGTKSAVVPTSDGDRLLYNEESTEVWFTDYGFGQLVDGHALVDIDPVYAETVNLDEDYHVFIQVYGDAEIFVSQRTPRNFEIRARTDTNDLNAEFSYRIVAKRLGFESRRLDFAPWVTMENPHAVPTPLPPLPLPDPPIEEE